VDTDWGLACPEYLTCSQGKEQSPIDIPMTLEDGSLIGLHALDFSAYSTEELAIANNGHTIVVSSNASSTLIFRNNLYKLAQFHFHTPSENKIKGQAFEMEVHLVHTAVKDPSKLLVVGVQIETGMDNPFLGKFFSLLPPIDENDTSTRYYNNVSLNAKDLIPNKPQYFHFNGSLTTPACTEGVSWILYETPIQASAIQITLFKAIFKVNAREVQPLNARKVYEYTEASVSTTGTQMDTKSDNSFSSAGMLVPLVYMFLLAFWTIC